MKISYDVYVLSRERSKDQYNKFSSTFLSNTEEATDEYEFPQYADKPELITSNLDELLTKLFDAEDEEHAIYWNFTKPFKDGVSSGMVFFTDDGSMIFGLTVHEDNAAHILTELKNTLGSEIGGFAFEEPPPLNRKEFILSFSK